LPSLSLCLSVFALICYQWRADWCAAFTIRPAWVWPAVGLAIAAAGFGRESARLFTVVIAVWMLFIVVCVEEVSSILRFRPNLEAARRQTTSIRVISLNCAGTKDALAEIESHRPDIVLLQESPSKQHGIDFAQRLYGHGFGAVWGLDASIVARGDIVSSSMLRLANGQMAQARVRMPDGTEVEIVSLRLAPTLLRNDLWSAECWRDYADDRRRRREWLRAVVEHLEAVPRTLPLIVGGDFNAPAGDGVFRLLKPRLHDAFSSAGVGWGNTILNEFPVLRIDQVWVSEHFRPLAVRARKTQHSDHRVVICDLELRSRAGP
jgi:vancomycin resistance protein VanJ